MNRILILLACLLISSMVAAQNLKFYDVDGRELNRKTFLRKKNDSRRYLGISMQEGRTTITRLIKREKSGKLAPDSAKLIYGTLKKAGSNSLSGKLLILRYYPGPDRCNSTGTNDKDLIKERFLGYLKSVRSIKNAAQRSIFTTSEGLEKSEGIIDWLPDPGRLIQTTFFKHHYPCGSYVILKPNGDYFAYYGEYALDHVVKNAKKMAK